MDGVGIVVGGGCGVYLVFLELMMWIDVRDVEIWCLF